MNNLLRRGMTKAATLLVGILLISAIFNDNIAFAAVQESNEGYLIPYKGMMFEGENVCSIKMEEDGTANGVSHQFYLLHKANSGKNAYDLHCSVCGADFGRGIKDEDGYYYIPDFYNLGGMIFQDVKNHIIFTEDGTKVKAEVCKPMKWYTDDQIHESRCKCGLTFTESEDHVFEKYVKPATLNSNGVIGQECSICGYVDEYSLSTISRPAKFILSQTRYTFDGKIKNPKLTVKNEKGKTISPNNYTLKKSKGRVNVGRYTYNIEFKGRYSGNSRLSFVITPSRTEIESLTSKKGGIVIEWKKKTKQVDGYQIRYSTKKSMLSAQKTDIESSDITRGRIMGLSHEKKYYVQVRTYKMVNGEYFYSSWSKSKTIITK